MRTISQCITALIGTNIIMATLVLGVGSCTPDPRWCGHRIVPEDQTAAAGKFITESLRVSRPGREPVTIHEAEEAATHLYGICPYDCMESDYLMQARREIALEATQ